MTDNGNTVRKTLNEKQHGSMILAIEVFNGLVGHLM